MNKSKNCEFEREISAFEEFLRRIESCERLKAYSPETIEDIVQTLNESIETVSLITNLEEYLGTVKEGVEQLEYWDKNGFHGDKDVPFIFDDDDPEAEQGYLELAEDFERICEPVLAEKCRNLAKEVKSIRS